MILRTTPRLARMGPRLRNAVLVLFALFIAHDSIYLAQFGAGGDFARAMTEGGHDAYWAPASLVIGAAAALIFLSALGLLVRLDRRAPRTGCELPPGPSYLNELASTWLSLFPTVALLFGLQENVEHYLVHGHLIGLDALFGSGSSLVVPVLAATTFALAALGSLVRWRIRVLAARITAALERAYPRIFATRHPSAWATIAATIALRWILDRGDAGRAPPRILPRTVVTA